MQAACWKREGGKCSTRMHAARAPPRPRFVSLPALPSRRLPPPRPPQVVECSFDVERRVWLYMRDRPDKLQANHRSVFEKVMTSITDNITVRR